MPITGGVKFFERSRNLFVDGASAVTSSGQAAANRALDRNPLTKWRSVGSTDATVETFEVTFPQTYVIDRISLLDINLKEFTIKYHNGVSFVDFSNVIGIDGAIFGGITETTFADTTAYYEFDAVSTDRVLITMQSTQVVDQEKIINQIICTSELGTLQGYPLINSLTHSKNQRTRKALSGREVIQKSIETTEVRLDFRNYPPGTDYHPDADLMFDLFDRDNNFIVWLCGGRRGTDYFRYTLRGFRLEDQYEMQVSRDFRVSYSKNSYISLINLSVSLVEAI